MKVKINTPKILVGLLFILVAMLFGAIGLRLNLDSAELKTLFFIGIGAGFVSLVLLCFGALIAVLISNNKKKNPSKIRDRLTQLFNFVEEHTDKYIRKIKAQNFFFASYYFVVCLIGATFYACVSTCFFVKPITLVALPIMLVAVCPIRKALEYLLKRDFWALTDGGIKKEEFNLTYNFFDNIIKEELGKGYNLSLEFGSVQDLKVALVAKVVVTNLNAYAFMLFTEEELDALVRREVRALKDKRCKKLVKVLQSRMFYLGVATSSKVVSAYVSFIIGDSLTKFEFAKNALKRAVERRKDELVKNEEFAKAYMLAYKKHCVIDRFFSDARSFITLKMCQNGGLRDFIKSVYDIFLELIPTFGNEWEKEVENKLKAVVCDKLTYSEKQAIFGFGVSIEEHRNNANDEQKTIYDKYNVEYYESTKMAYEPKKQALDNYYREVERFEQFPNEYDERLKLIFVAHAYYMTAQLDKAESVYNSIINGGDTTPEIYFDYGCFLLLAKKDVKGIDYIYKAMENENLVEEGLEVLGRHFVYSGDENGYKEFCDYKAKRLDKMVNEYDSKMLDTKAKFEKVSLDGQVLGEIIEKLSKDNNIDEIYCADSKTKTGAKIIVFAIAVRNKTKEAFVESYERVFSILDNDYGKYDTFLISLDAEPDKNLANRIKKDKIHLIYKK